MHHSWVPAVLLAAVLAAGCAMPASTPPEPTPPMPDQPGAPEAGLAPPLAGIPLAPTRATQVSSGSEPEIVTDRNGRFVWIGDTSGGYWSDNNGTQWHNMGSYPGGVNAAFVDGWTLAQDDAGNLYAGVLRANRVDVARSADGGQSWNQVGYAAGVSGVADRPWLAAKGDGEVALFYFDAPTVLVGFAEHCARSTDGGLTFVDRDPLAVLPGVGGSAFYDSEGRLYFSSSSGSLFRFDSTCVAGTTSIPMASGQGVDNMIQATADGTDLYMATATGNSAAITLFGSHGSGQVTKLVVSPPELQSNTYAAVDARNGQVVVAWYGSTTAGDPSSTSFAGEFHTYVAVVDGFWTAAPKVTRYQVSATPNHQGPICMGGVLCDDSIRGLLDYFKVAYDVWGGIHVAFVDDADGNPNVLHAHIPPKRATMPGPQSPTASFSVRLADRVATADGTKSSSPVRSALDFEWDWGDGARGEGRVAEHAYADYGSYDVRLTVTDNAGRQGTSKVRIVVDGSSVGPPSVEWATEPAEPVAGEPVTFRDLSEAMEGAAIASAQWDFGDGGTDAGSEVQHVFDAPGTYVVTLTVRDDVGSEASLARDVVVAEGSDPAPTQTQPPEKRTDLPLAVLVVALAASLAIARRRPTGR